ncbi:hypothetical protein PIIN_09371 [Serendipita indica DSM 11827]|uniref:Uncharacterized protein n=1 Tax=Serendipita indica (strain DSM 11827) TaxID=1109443 RepID=G4TVP4_SERID|nr:hypothetical protein PIIN_09371 [Serendipita indica DSM 11827]
MSLLVYTLLSLCLLAIGVVSAPTPANILLAQKYAPQFRFHKSETYFPSTIEFFLAGGGGVKAYDANGPISGAPFPLTTANLGDLANRGSGMYLTTDVKANLNGFLLGQNPNSGAGSTYVFIAPKANGVVDLYYWIFCPYNQGKKIIVLGYVGDHIGDWERITVRTVNGVATSVDYHAHGDTGSGTIPWSQTPKFIPSSPNSPPSTSTTDPTARPVAYVAQGSHGMWSSAGSFTYVNAIIFQLKDTTSDGGVYWDTVNALTTIGYPDTYSGSQNWLNYVGAWGNKGVNNCWWYGIHDECELVDGPTGPVRADLLGAAKTSGSLFAKASADLPSHVLATPSTDSSTYKVHLETPLISNAALGVSYLAVEQLCATLNQTATQDTSLPVYSFTPKYMTFPLKRTAEYTLSVQACDEGSFVYAYAVGYCANSLDEEADSVDGCNFGQRRKIRAFSNDVVGAQEVRAVVTEDLDNWVL